MHQQRLCTAFKGTARIASGPLSEVVLKAKAVIDADETASILIFDNESSNLVEVDFRGVAADVLRRLPSGMGVGRPGPAGAPRRGPGRPKLGVVAREVTLLPRHWDWLSKRPGGASVALRKLVEEAKSLKGGMDRLRQTRESAYRFMVAMAGNERGFEEATRALFAGNGGRFDQLVEAWPQDIRDHTRYLAAPAFAAHDRA